MSSTTVIAEELDLLRGLSSLGARRAFGLVAVEDPRHRAPLVGVGVRHDAVGLPPLVALRQVLGDGEALGVHEEKAVAVLVLLHLLAGAGPPPQLPPGRGGR